jgi:hypothetical protein
MVFSAQRVPNCPRYSHSFATFIKASGEETCLADYRLEALTISWLPESLDVQLFRLRPERGENFDLPTTLEWAYTKGTRVSLWGPYQIQQELYERALEHVARLESRPVRYKAIDSAYRTSRVSNCVHAIGDLAGNHRLRVVSPWFGEVASHYVTHCLEPWVIDPACTHDWVAVRLGLADYPLIRRSWQDAPRLFPRPGFSP